MFVVVVDDVVVYDVMDDVAMDFLIAFVVDMLG